MEDTNKPLEQDTNKIIEERRAKLTALRAKGIAFPNDFVREHHAGDLMATHAATEREVLEREAITATMAGRIMLKRVMGKASFATIQDTSGRIQIYVSEGDTGKEAQDAFKHYDIGDIIGVSGTLFKTKTNELTIRCK